jgi:V/A-type H+-transporting ATPase subunit D
MGLKLSNFGIRLRGLHAPVAVTATTASYDEAKDRARKMLPLLVSYASVTQTVIILSRELKKVQRRVNALEKIFIPQHEEAKRYIVGRIEEMEREEVFVKKIIRQRQSAS